MNNTKQPLGVIAGRLGKNPVQYTRNLKKGGTAKVAKFSLAVTVLGQDGAETVWYQCSAWKKRCELVMKHLQKGDSVQLHGFARRSTYFSKKTNQEESVLEFDVMFITFLGKALRNINAETLNQQDQPAEQTAVQEALPGVASTNPF